MAKSRSKPERKEHKAGKTAVRHAMEAQSGGKEAHKNKLKGQRAVKRAFASKKKLEYPAGKYN